MTTAAPAPTATPTRTAPKLVHNYCATCLARVCDDKKPGHTVRPATPYCSVCWDTEWLYAFGREHARCGR